jgi:hypothetical protein
MDLNAGKTRPPIRPLALRFLHIVLAKKPVTRRQHRFDPFGRLDL